jgi:hypothetical protein
VYNRLQNWGQLEFFTGNNRLMWSSPPIVPTLPIGSYCPNGYTLIGEYCLYFSTMLSTWNDAKYYCKYFKNNGWLVSITNTRLQTLILQTTLLTENIKNIYFTGSICDRSNSDSSKWVWRWDHGEQWGDYTYWSYDVPPPVPVTNNDCCVIMSRYGNGLWEISPCSLSILFICQTGMSYIYIYICIYYICIYHIQIYYKQYLVIFLLLNLLILLLSYVQIHPQVLPYDLPTIRHHLHLYPPIHPQ